MKNIILLLFIFLLLQQSTITAEEEKPKSETKSESKKPITKIAFGSCSNQRKKQPLWKPILETKPDLWIWTGDIVYADGMNFEKLTQEYNQLKNNPDYAKLCNQCPVIGVWDDHDYGRNNGGKEYKNKEISRKALLDFLDEPADSERRKQKGVYAACTYGPTGKQVKVILLDVRYHREKPGPESDILGDKQWKWLKKQLTENKAQITLICSGIQIIPKEHKFEKWANFPKARKRLFDLLRETKTKGVIFISGDRHIAEISKTEEADVGNPIYEITSSGMTHSWATFPGEKNSLRVGEVFTGLHFGLIEIEWGKSPVGVSLQVRNRSNQIAQKVILKGPFFYSVFPKLIESRRV